MFCTKASSQLLRCFARQTSLLHSFGIRTASSNTNNNNNPLTGVWPIIATPFKSSNDESIDYDSFEKIIDFFGNQLSDVCNGLTIIGVLGESNRLIDSERESLIKIASDVMSPNNRLNRICVGTSHSSTHGTIKLTEQAMKYGINYAMITPSKEAVPTDDKIYQYYANICNYFRNNNNSNNNNNKQEELGIVLQDHPASTQVHMNYNLLLNIILDNIDIIKCVKLESLPSPPKIRKLKKDLNNNININGNNNSNNNVTILGGLGALYGIFDLEGGSDGFMTGFAFPEILYCIQNEYIKNGNFNKAKEIYQKYLPLIVFEQQPGIGIRKEIYKKRGLLKSSHVRHPGVNASNDATQQLDEWIKYLLPNTDITNKIDPASL